MYILGLDCGGTSSQALLTNKSGQVLGRGRGGPANYTVNGIEGVLASVSQAIGESLQESQLDLVALKCQGVVLALGVSGASRDSDLVSLTQAFHQEGFRHVIVQHDASIALLGALSGADGVVVIAGTGSIAYGIRDNTTCRVGGWGYLLGDEGSAFCIALKALRRVMWGYDGRAPQDQTLEKAVLQYFEISQVQELIPVVYQAPLNRGFIGGFSKSVTALANNGHILSRKILAQAGCELGRLALATIKELALTETQGRVGACGGVFAAGRWVLTPMQEQIWLDAVGQTLTLPDFEPVVGAVLLGTKYLDLNVTEIIGGIRQSL